MPKTDYYEVLGLGKTATAEEIKRAYRKQALKHHPDKGGDPEKFKEAGEAYAVLSNPDKRRRYDQLGHAGLGDQPFGAGGFDFNNFDFFNFGGFGDVFSQMMRQAMSNVQAEVEISLPQAVLGDTIRAKFGGEELTIKIPPGTRDGQALRFRGRGNAYEGGRGDLTIVLRVNIPKRLTPRERELYEELKRLETEQRAKRRFW